VRTVERTDKYTWSDMCDATGSPRLKRVIEIFFIIGLLGSCVGYMIISKFKIAYLFLAASLMTFILSHMAWSAPMTQAANFKLILHLILGGIFFLLALTK